MADGHAKTAAEANASVSPKDETMYKQEVLARQEWLTRLHALLNGERKPDIDVVHVPQTATSTESKGLFPRWEWDANIQLFGWKPKIPRDLPPPLDQTMIQQNWKIFCDFLNTLHWQLGESRMMSYAELAVAFHVRGFRFPSLEEDSATLREVISTLRKLCTAASQCDGAFFFPGTQTNVK